MSRHGWRVALAAALALGCVTPAAQAEAQEDSLANAQYWLGSRGPDELELSLLSASEARVGDTIEMTLKIHNPTAVSYTHLTLPTKA